MNSFNNYLRLRAIGVDGKNNPILENCGFDADLVSHGAVHALEQKTLAVNLPLSQLDVLTLVRNPQIVSLRIPEDHQRLLDLNEDDDDHHMSITPPQTSQTFPTFPRVVFSDQIACATRNIKRVVVSNQQLVQADRLFESIQKRELLKIEDLKLSSIPLNAPRIQSLCNALFSVPLLRLRSLDLSSTMMGDEGLLLISDLISLNDKERRKVTPLLHLRSLKLTNNGITHTGMIYFSKAIQSCPLLPRLNVLNVANNSIGARGMDSMSYNVLQNDFLSSSIEELDLSETMLGDEGIRGFAAAFPTNHLRNLQKLSLSNNGISDTGVAYLCTRAQIGHTFSSLREFDMSANDITPKGAYLFLSHIRWSGIMRNLVDLNLLQRQTFTDSEWLNNLDNLFNEMQKEERLPYLITFNGIDI